MRCRRSKANIRPWPWNRRPIAIVGATGLSARPSRRSSDRSEDYAPQRGVVAVFMAGFSWTSEVLYDRLDARLAPLNLLPSSASIKTADGAGRRGAR
jgi:hypothetical protein